MNRNGLFGMVKLVMLGLLLIPLGILSADAQMSGHIMLTPADVRWVDGPASLPAGAKMAVLEGNPSQPGMFTLRLKVPAGYQVAPHFHSSDERITVLKGIFMLGTGDVFSRSALHVFNSASFIVMPAGHRHFAMAKTAATIQLTGMGPWTITYVNSADDPRNQPTTPAIKVRGHTYFE